MPEKTYTFLPTVAEFPDDVEASWELQKPLADKGYCPGFMVFCRKGILGLSDTELTKKRYDNLAKYADIYNAPVIVMLNNLPVEDIDTLSNGAKASEHIERGVEFASALPIGKRKAVTFHLNSLVSQDEFFSKTQQEWYELFQESISKRLRTAAEFAKNKGIGLLVESVPVPEFGDLADSELSRLRNPFYMFSGNLPYNEIISDGLGICLDLCHSRTIYGQAQSAEEGIMFDEDKRAIKEKRLSLLEDVSSLVPARDIVHFNDGKGRYTSRGGVFYEGLVPGEGEIENMPEITKTLLERKLPLVIEVAETDFKGRPNTKRAINFLLRV